MNYAAIYAESSALAVATIASEMAEWQLTDYDANMLPNFYPGERKKAYNGQSLAIDRANFTSCLWAGNPQFVADARKAMAVKDSMKRTRAVRAVCDAEREAVATALLLRIFGISDLSPQLAKLGQIEDMEFLTVSPSVRAEIEEAINVWLS